MRQRNKNKSATLSQRLKSRKLLVGLVCLAAGTAIDLLTERGLSQNLLTLLIAILGIYVTGNVGAKAARAIQKGGNNRANKSDTDTSRKVDTAMGEVSELKTAQQQYEQYLSGVLTTVEQLQEQMRAVNENVNSLMGNKKS